VEESVSTDGIVGHELSGNHCLDFREDHMKINKFVFVCCRTKG
jgi:hypothetical protein